MSSSSGISRKTFVAGIIVAIVVSSLVSVTASMEWALVKGPRGATGLTGATGLSGATGLTGPQGPRGLETSYASAPVSSYMQLNLTAPNTFVDLPGLSVTINLNTTCNLLILFSIGILELGTVQPMHFRAYIDSLISAFPTEAELCEETSNLYQGFSWNFMYQGASAGSHTITIQYAEDIEGMTVWVGDGTLNVLGLPQ